MEEFTGEERLEDWLSLRGRIKKLALFDKPAPRHLVDLVDLARCGRGLRIPGHLRIYADKVDK